MLYEVITGEDGGAEKIQAVDQVFDQVVHGASYHYQSGAIVRAVLPRCQRPAEK